MREAHANDEWPVRTTLRIKQHTTLDERITAAKTMVETTGLNWPCWVDNMYSEFSETYRAWPVRAYIVDGEGRMEWIWQPKFPGYYDFGDIVPALQTALENNKKQGSNVPGEQGRIKLEETYEEEPNPILQGNNLPVKIQQYNIQLV